MEALGRVIAGALAEGLGVDRETLLRPFGYGNSTLRLIHYPERPVETLDAMPAVDGEGDARRWLVGVPHCDNGFITLLWQDQVGGLQVRTPTVAGKMCRRVTMRWWSISGVAGRLSGDRVQATEHRIVGPPMGIRSRSSSKPAVDAHIAAPDAAGDGVISTAIGYGSACRRSSNSRGWSGRRSRTREPVPRHARLGQELAGSARRLRQTRSIADARQGAPPRRPRTRLARLGPVRVAPSASHHWAMVSVPRR